MQNILLIFFGILWRLRGLKIQKLISMNTSLITSALNLKT